MEILFVSKDAFHYMLSFLHPYEIVAMLFCCKSWKKAIDEDNSLWKILCRKEGLMIPEEIKEISEKMEGKKIFVSLWESFIKKRTRFTLLNMNEEDYLKMLKTDKDKGLGGEILEKRRKNNKHSQLRSKFVRNLTKVIRNGIIKSFDSQKNLLKGDVVLLSKGQRFEYKVNLFEGRTFDCENLYILNKNGEEILNPPFIFKGDRIIAGKAKCIISKKLESKISTSEKFKERASFKIGKSISEWSERNQLYLKEDASILIDSNILLLNIETNGSKYFILFLKVILT